MKSLKYVFVVFVKLGISKVVFVKLRLFFFFKSVLIGVWLLYNDVLVSTAFKMNRPCIYIYTHPPFGASFPFRSLQHLFPTVPCAIERISLVIYSMHSGGYMSIPVSQCIPPPFPPWSPYICSLSSSSKFSSKSHTQIFTYRDFVELK